MRLHTSPSWSFFVTSRILLAAFTSDASVASRIWTLKLDKQHVPVHRKGAIVAYKTAYFGTVYVGMEISSPFTVMFDTGSGHVFLPSETCDTEACTKRRRYASHPDSIMDIDEDGGNTTSNETKHRTEAELLYGTGSVSGEFVKDRICLGNDHANAGQDASHSAMGVWKGCTRLGLLSASAMTNEPFEQFHFDGVIGLGLDGLTLRKDFSFFDRLSKEGDLPEPCFSIFLARGGNSFSEISFGGHNQDHADSNFSWAPVASPEQGYWQVALNGVLVGDKVLDICADGNCRAVLDSGTSLLGIPKEAISNLHRMLARPVEDNAQDCKTVPGPPIVFDFGKFQLQLGAEDYSRPAPMTVTSRASNTTFAVCRASLLPVPANVDTQGNRLFILGEPFLQRHYTKYDWHKREIGFALARQEHEVSI